MSDGTRSSEQSAGSPARRVAFIAAAGAFLDGYDLLIINAALILLVPAFGLSGSATGWLTSLPFAAMGIGALLAGRVCDRIGRRRVFMVDVALFFTFSILQALVEHEWQLFVMRTLMGFAIGLDMPTGASMLAEYSPRGRSGSMTGIMQTVWVAGGMVAAGAGYIIYQVAGADAWRWMFASAAVPALVVAILRHQLPETPRWLAQARAPQRRLPARAILAQRRYRRPVAFFTAYWFVESFLGGPPFIYTALIFTRVVHFKGSQSLLLSLCLSAIYVATNILCQVWALDRFGRKPLAVVICAIAGIGAIFTGVLQATTIPLVIAFGVLAVMTQIAPAPFWPWSVEQLPTSIRATGQSIGSAGGKLGQFAALTIFTATTIVSIGWTPYFVGVGIAFIALALFALRFGPETRDVDYDALDAEAVEPDPAQRRRAATPRSSRPAVSGSRRP